MGQTTTALQMRGRMLTRGAGRLRGARPGALGLLLQRRSAADSGVATLLGIFALTVLLDMPIAFGLPSPRRYLLTFETAPLMVAAQQLVAGLDSFTCWRSRCSCWRLS